MSSSGIDRAFERRLATLVNAREPRVLQGGLKGVEKESLRVSRRRPHRAERASARARLGAHARAHHDRLLRSADRAGHAGVPRVVGAAAVPVRPASVRLSPSRRAAAVGDQHAVHHRRRCEHPDRALRPLEHRPHEGGVSPRPRPSLRPHDAGDLRRALQLLVPRALLAGARPRRCRSASADQEFVSAQYFALLRNYRRHGWLILYLFGNSPALCGSFVRGREHTLQRVRARHAVRAVRDVAAHERSRLSQQEPGRRADLRQQPR